MDYRTYQFPFKQHYAPDLEH